MTFTEAIGVESPTLFGLYFVFGCLWALATGAIAIISHALAVTDMDDTGRTAARLFFATPIWPAMAALWVFRGLMALHAIAFEDQETRA